MEQTDIIKSLLNLEAYPYPASEIKHVETHISHVFLVGDFAYKLKKEVVFSFADFSSLEKRKYFCLREIELNKRYAKGLYIEVVPISIVGKEVKIENGENIVEYAVKMNRFLDDNLLEKIILDGKANEELIVETTKKIASFHKMAKNSPEYFSFDALKKFSIENISSLEDSLPEAKKDLKHYRKLLENTLSKNKELIEKRQKTHVKELHGDLHSGNICIYQGEPTLFDGVEFSKSLSCCDTWADFAFFIMDLEKKERGDLASISLNSYLEMTDDYEGLALLPLFLSYRAGVRSKVNALKYTQSKENNDKLESLNYLEQAINYLQPSKPKLIALGGISGSGKSFVAKELAKKLGGICIRSDVLRKNLIENPRYNKSDRGKIYKELRNRAELALKQYRPVIIDATHLEESEREKTGKLAKESSANFTGLWCDISLNTAIKRVAERQNDPSDATKEVVLKQFNNLTPPTTWQTISTEDSKEDVKKRIFSDF